MAQKTMATVALVAALVAGCGVSAQRGAAASALRAPQPAALAPSSVTPAVPGRVPTPRPPVRVAAGERYRIICHFDCGAGVASDALRVAEAAWPLAAPVFGPPRAAPATLLDIHLYRTAAEYRRERGGFLRRSPRRLAVTEPSTRTAHIALRAAIADTTLRRFGLPVNVLRIVAHEAFHLAALVHAPRSVLLPEWLLEGAASWAEHEALRAVGFAAEPEHEPVASTYLWLLQRRAQRGTLPRVDEVLTGSLAALDEQEQYAVRKLLFERLLARPPAEPLPAAIAAVLAGSGRGTRPGAVAAALHERLFGTPQQHEPLARAMLESIRAATPRWVQAARSLDLLPDGTWLQIGLTGGAEAWRNRFGATTRVAGDVEPLTPAGVATVLIGTNEAGSLAVAFDFGGAELIVRRDRPGAESIVLARAPLAAATGADSDAAPALSFDVVFVSGRLRVSAASSAIELDLTLDDATPNGRWGVAAAAGANVVWHGLTD